MDIFITMEVAKAIKDYRRVYTRFMPSPQLCITDKPKMAFSEPSFQGDYWYYCPNCKGLYKYEGSIPTLLEGIRLCPICYRANQHEY